MSKPRPTRLLDPAFRYVPAAQTDVRATWERERKRLAAEARAKRRAEKEVTTKWTGHEPPRLVLPIGMRRKA